jgi:hypothetical protein
MAQAIVNKLLHQPTVRLKASAAGGDGTLASVVAELFGFDGAEAAEVPAAPARGSRAQRAAAPSSEAAAPRPAAASNDRS